MFNSQKLLGVNITFSLQESCGSESGLLEEFLTPFLELVTIHLERGEGVLVHCMAGIHRCSLGIPVPHTPQGRGGGGDGGGGPSAPHHGGGAGGGEEGEARRGADRRPSPAPPTCRTPSEALAAAVGLFRGPYYVLRNTGPERSGHPALFY